MVISTTACVTQRMSRLCLIAFLTLLMNTLLSSLQPSLSLSLSLAYSLLPPIAHKNTKT